MENENINHNKVLTQIFQTLRCPLRYLIDEVGNNENHPLTSLMETIGSLIETYESKYINVWPLANCHFNIEWAFLIGSERRDFMLFPAFPVWLKEDGP